MKLRHLILVAACVTTASAQQPVQGTSASAAANSGNPVKIGGAFNTAQPLVTNGQTVDVQTTARGSQIVATGIGVDPFNVTSAIPLFAQAPVGNKSSGNVASLGTAFGSNNTKGNSIIVSAAVGNNTAPTISDTNSNVYKQTVSQCNSTTFCVYEFLAVNVGAGANTVTVNNGGSSVSIAMGIYEFSGILTATSTAGGTTSASTAALDATNSTSATSTAPSPGAVTPAVPDEFAVSAYAVGTGAQTITVTAPYTNDTGQQNPGTPNGLYSFVSASDFLATTASTTPAATITSEPWAAVVATYRPAVLPISGQVSITGNVSVIGTGTAGSAATGVVTVQGISGGTNLNVQVSAALPAGTNVIGHVIADSGSTTAVTQATATNLNAAVVGTGTAGSPAGNILTIQGVASMTKLLVTPDSVALPANQSVNVNQWAGASAVGGNGTTTSGTARVTLSSDSTGQVALAAGTALVGEASQGTTAATTNSALTSSLSSAASTNSTNVKASAGNVYGYSIINTTATLYYLRMYNSSSAPTCSSATGYVESIPIPASTTGAGVERWHSVGQGFTTGIGFCLTGGGGSTDNTNAATGVYLTILYK